MPSICLSSSADLPTSSRFASVRVAVVDRHWFVRRGLCALIGIGPGFQVCGEMDPQLWDDAALARWAPDVVVLDVSDGDGEGRVRALRGRTPAPGVVALALQEVPGQRDRLRAAGASEFLLKTAEPERIYAAVRLAAADATGDGAATPAESAPQLDPTETEILSLIGLGLPMETIASRLRLPLLIVEGRLSRIRHKLNLGSGVELVEYCVSANRRAGRR